MMLAVKFTGMNNMPEYCDDCIYYEIRPHPYKGWTEACGFCIQSMDDDAPEDWIYDGNGRPKNCPLLEIPDDLIRCKDCKWFGESGRAIEIVDDSDKPKEDDYCSFAERREDE